MSASASAVADVRDTYGVALIGLLVSTILYGVTITQTWIYYCHYRSRDSIMLTGLIASLFILDTLHTILCIYSVYWYLILNFGNVANLSYTMWAINVQVDVNGLVGFLVQVFYARRVYIMSKSIVIPLVIVIFGGLCFALGFVCTFKGPNTFSHSSFFIWVIGVGMSSAALTDVLIALAMCWYLIRKRTGFSHTDSIIRTLMFYSVSSGLLTSILATSMFITFVAWRTSYLYVVLFWLMGKCYVNSFLAMLNSRDSLRERPSNDASNNGLHLTSVRQSKTPFKCKTGPAAVSANVHRTAHTDSVTSEHDHKEQELEKSEGITTSLVHHDDGSPESSV